MNRDKRNSLWLAIQYSVTIIFSLITLKLNLSNYGKELFGSWILISSLWGFGRALDFGLGTSLVKFVAEFNHKDSTKLKELLSTCLILMVLLGVVVLIAIFGIGQLIYFSTGEIFNQDNITEINAVFLILGVSFYINYIAIVIKSVFEGMSDFVNPSKINIVNSFLILLSVVICFIFNLSLTTLAYLYLASSLLVIILYFILFRIKHSSLKISLKHFEFPLVKKVFSFSLAIQGAAVFGSLIDPLIKFLIGNFSSVGAVSVYEIARRFVTAITGLFSTTFSTILPKASILSGKDEFKTFLYDECAKLSKIGITYSGTVFGIGAFIIPVLIQQIFKYDEAVLIFFILALPESINNYGYSIYNFLIGIEKAYFLVMMQILNVAVIGVSVFTGLHIFGNILGLLGYGLTVVVANFLMIIFVRQVSDISIRKYLKISKVYKLLFLLMCLMATILLLFFGKMNFYMVIFGLGSLSLVVFLNDLRNYFKLILQMIGFNRDV